MPENLTRVTLNLTDRDIENAVRLAQLPAIRNRTQAISTSLAFTRYVVDALQQEGAHLFLKDSKGEYQRIVMPDFTAGGAAAEKAVAAF